MGMQALTLKDIKGRSFEEVIQDIVAQESTVTVLFPDGQEVLIQPKPRLKPLPKLEGRMPEGWKDAIYVQEGHRSAESKVLNSGASFTKVPGSGQSIS